VANDNQKPLERTETSSGADWLLQLLGFIAIESADTEIGLTLNVGGLVVSGLLVSPHRFFKSVAQDTLGTEAGLGDFLVKTMENAYSDTFSGESVIYLHLDQAQIFMPGQPPLPGDRTMLWRGRLSEIDGWSFGSFSVGDAAPSS
jgi:hypothetical protein